MRGRRSGARSGRASLLCRPAPPTRSVTPPSDPGSCRALDRGAMRRGRSGPHSPAQCRERAGRPETARHDHAAGRAVVAKASGNAIDQPDGLGGAPGSSAPTSEVIALPPKSATTSRRWRRANTIGSEMHCVGIREFSRVVDGLDR